MESYNEPEEIKKIEEQLIKVDKEKEEAINIQKFEKAAALRDEYQKLKYFLEESRKNWEEDKSKKLVIIGKEEIAAVLSRTTKIPVNKINENENQKLRLLEEKIHEKVIGQEEAVKAVSKAIRRNRVGLKDPDRPIGSFLFLGPTGVGKTELAKTVAQVLFDNEEAIIRLDMSEYMESHSVSKLIGSHLDMLDMMTIIMDLQKK